MAIWHWFQRTADKIQAMELPPDIKEFLQKMNDALPDKLSKGLIGFITKLYKRQGKEVAVGFLEKLTSSMKKILL